MEDQPLLAATSRRILSYPVERTYTPKGHATLQGLVFVLCGGLMASAVVGIVATTWVVSRWLQSGSNPRSSEYVNFCANHPFDAFDAFVIYPRARHHGFVGYMKLRGPSVWVLALLQVAVVGFVGILMGRMSARRPFCEDCNEWFKKPIHIAVLPGKYANDLVAVIETNDPTAVMDLHHRVDGSFEGNCAIARIHTCPKCAKVYTDVVLAVFDGLSPLPFEEMLTGKSSNRHVLLKLRRCSQKMVAALRYDAAPEARKTETATVPTTEPANDYNGREV